MTRTAVPPSQARFWLGVAGVAAAALAVAMDSRVLEWAAVVLLGVAFVSRLVAARRARSEEGTGEGGADP